MQINARFIFVWEKGQPGYSLFNNDKKKGGCNILAYMYVSSSKILCKRIKLNRVYKTMELIILQMTIGRGEIRVIMKAY